MKPEKKPFIVEIKNRRRLSRQEHSIWGKIDLKVAGAQVAAEEKSGENGATIPMQQPETAAEQSTADISA